MPAGRPRIIASPEEMQELGDAFFAECDASDDPYTITGLALALGLSSRDSLVDYSRREEYSATVKRLKARCEQWCERRALATNGAGAIFALKNYGWTDRTETALTGANGGPIEALITIEFVKPESGESNKS